MWFNIEFVIYMAYVSDAHIVSDIYFFIDISGPMRKKVEQGY